MSVLPGLVRAFGLVALVCCFLFFVDLRLFLVQSLGFSPVSPYFGFELFLAVTLVFFFPVAYLRAALDWRFRGVNFVERLKRFLVVFLVLAVLMASFRHQQDSKALLVLAGNGGVLVDGDVYVNGSLLGSAHKGVVAVDASQLKSPSNLTVMWRIEGEPYFSTFEMAGGEGNVGILTLRLN
ncbi:Uncharacterised protein [uncultured archaeon]|nr:Uncharacterised protein [uncultured archaeon]